MTSVSWSWEVRERLNLSEAPCDDWEAVYHWLSDQNDGEVVMQINEDLEVIAYIVEAH